MSSPKKILDLEQDITLTMEDLAAAKRLAVVDEVQDLNGYLEFLDQIGAFETPGAKPRFYDEPFRL